MAFAVQAGSGVGRDDPPGQKAGSQEPFQSRAIHEASLGSRLRDSWHRKLSICLQRVKIPSVTSADHLKGPGLRKKSSFWETLNKISFDSTLRSTPPAAVHAFPDPFTSVLACETKESIPDISCTCTNCFWAHTVRSVPVCNHTCYKHALLLLETQTKSLKYQNKPCGVVDSF